MLSPGCSCSSQAQLAFPAIGKMNKDGERFRLSGFLGKEQSAWGHFHPRKTVLLLMLLLLLLLLLFQNASVCCRKKSLQEQAYSRGELGLSPLPCPLQLPTPWGRRLTGARQRLTSSLYPNFREASNLLSTWAWIWRQGWRFLRCRHPDNKADNCTGHIFNFPWECCCWGSIAQADMAELLPRLISFNCSASLLTNIHSWKVYVTL